MDKNELLTVLSNEKNKSKLVELIKDFSKRNEYECAKLCIDRLAERPKSLQAIIDLCQDFLTTESTELLSFCVHNGMNNYPRNSDLLVIYSRYLFSLSKFKESYSCALKAIKFNSFIYSSSKLTIYHLVSLLENKPEFDFVSIELLKKQINKEDYEIRQMIIFIIGQFYLSKNKFKYAKRYFERNELTNVDFVHPFLGMCEFGIKNYPKSEEYFKEYVESYAINRINREREIVLGVIGVNYEGLYYSCLGYLGAIYINSKDQTLVNRGIMYLNDASVYGNSSFSRILGYYYYYKLKDYKNALRHFKYGADSKISPDLTCANNAGYIYQHYMGNNQFKNAKKYYEKALLVDNALSYYNLGTLYEEKGASYYSISIEYYEKALKLRYKKAKYKINKLSQLLNENKNMASAFLKQFKDSNLEGTKLFKKISNNIDKIFASSFYKLDNASKKPLVNSIYIATAIDKITYDSKDFSPAITLVGKSLESLLKREFIIPYIDYLKNIFPKNEDMQEFIKIKVKSDDVIFMLNDFNKIINSEEEKTFNTFIDFIKIKFNLSKEKSIIFVKEISSDINQIREIRNLATHSISTPRNRYIDCLNILLFDGRLFSKILTNKI